MQKRLYQFFNFFAFNLLFFALYLNFIHKDAEVTLPTLPKSTAVEVHVPVAAPPAVKADVKGKAHKAAPAVEQQNKALKLSLN